MRYGVLGPLAVQDAGGGQVAVPEAKVRALLAALLVHGGAPVSADRLIEDLWEGRPPGRPLNTLQTKVSQLRRALGAEQVPRTPAGYRLRLEAGGLDAARFRDAVEEAHRAGGPSERARLLTGALRLWRGPAYADFAGAAFARDEAARLEELRLDAAECLAEARIELGDADGALPDLRELVGAHPLRERLHALYMRALYRAGRQGEALDAFHGLRTRLRDELGVDPSAQVGEVHTAILRREAAEPPRSGPPERPRSNLPAPPTPLIGREAESEHLCRELRAPDGGRLLTVTGPGGVGKTRLAVAAVRSLRADFPDGTWLVELAGVDRRSSAADIAERVVTVLGLCEGAAGAEAADLVGWLCGALAGRRLILLLDNCEHVVAQVAEVAGALLAAAPEVRTVVTGQEALDVPGEAVLPLPPLALPPASAGPGLEPIAASGAVRLFTERARAASPGFVLTAENAPAVAAICRRLDGIPLAIELVAARVRALAPERIAAGLDDRFALPTGPGRGRPTRQQTLRAMIDWSWGLLTGEERTLLRRLAVSPDGTTPEAARALCPDRPPGGRSALDLLSRLVDRSLVVRDGDRYRLLESVAAYSAEKLAEAGETGEVRRRFVAFHTERAELADARLRGARQRRSLEALDAETVNMRRALELAVRHSDAGSALRLVNALAWYWSLRSRLGEARRSLAAALALPGGPPVARAVAGAWLASFEGRPGRADAADPVLRARLLCSVGTSLYREGDRGAGRRLVEEALAGARAAGDRWGEAAALAERADHRVDAGDADAMRADAVRSAELFAAAGDRWGRLRAGGSLARAAELDRDRTAVAALLEEGLRGAEELGLWGEAVETLLCLGHVAAAQDEAARARRFYARALRLAAERSHERGAAEAAARLAAAG
ncbi:BTAD domain-containing putative transcriptional regulator, partial [Nocardiopsis composta]|uniref:BTAD domain-containing putative transcriptional regulator n=1 Tax=Nocardiopsis composta TaxID=157465 RepID=UPI0031DC949E